MFKGNYNNKHNGINSVIDSIVSLNKQGKITNDDTITLLTFSATRHIEREVERNIDEFTNNFTKQLKRIFLQ
jgi:hypothetical protein